MPQAIRDGIVVVLVISGPLVLAAAFIGLLIGILQAATQVQEQTIGSALKIIGVFAIIIFAGFWMYQYLNQYTARTLSSAFTFVPRQTQKAIPAHVSDENSNEDDKFNVRFEGESEAEKPLKVIPPEKLEEQNLPKGAIPAGIPYLGSPGIPKSPPISKLLPSNLPKLPKQPLGPKLPLADFQEPKPLSPNAPKVPPNLQLPQGINVPAGDGMNAQKEKTDLQKINLLPEKPEDESSLEVQDDNAGEEDSPSWLN
ncbi:MAG: flagellar biosynthetic protein FliQ [Candidatus Melainabacteria bacterium]|nr:flagellar biosynthetic protein FliQ [Candidatus Melainabacteria bacterium]